MTPCRPLNLALLWTCLWFTGSGADSSAVETNPPGPKSDIPWLYTLAVEKNGSHFSFSLMKEGWLSFDTWQDGDAGEYVEQRIDLDDESFASLKQQFSSLFQATENEPKKKRGETPHYAFEEISFSNRMIEFSGHHPSIAQFLEQLCEAHQKPLPFPLSQP